MAYRCATPAMDDPTARPAPSPTSSLYMRDLPRSRSRISDSRTVATLSSGTWSACTFLNMVTALSYQPTADGDRQQHAPVVLGAVVADGWNYRISRTQRIGVVERPPFGTSVGSAGTVRTDLPACASRFSPAPCGASRLGRLRSTIVSAGFLMPAIAIAPHTLNFVGRDRRRPLRQTNADRRVCPALMMRDEFVVVLQPSIGFVEQQRRPIRVNDPEQTRMR